MRRRLIATCSLLALVVLGLAVRADAQTYPPVAPNVVLSTGNAQAGSTPIQVTGSGFLDNSTGSVSAPVDPGRPGHDHLQRQRHG